MKILLISDTHGRLDDINRLVAENDTECCFHLGDFCTYTLEGIDRLSPDLLYKQLMHCPRLTPKEREAIDRNDVESMRKLVRRYETYGDFEKYFLGKRVFQVPVYAVPGNNDDAVVLARVADQMIQNLIFLNESRQLKIEDFLICGIGGSICADVRDVPVFGFSSTVNQIRELEKRLQRIPPDIPRLLLTHMPPDENPELMHLVQTIRPELAICGHTHHWNEQTLDSGTRVLTLPCSARGYAILELKSGCWNYQLCKTGEEQ